MFFTFVSYVTSFLFLTAYIVVLPCLLLCHSRLPLLSLPSSFFPHPFTPPRRLSHCFCLHLPFHASCRIRTLARPWRCLARLFVCVCVCASSVVRFAFRTFSCFWLLVRCVIPSRTLFLLPGCLHCSFFFARASFRTVGSPFFAHTHTSVLPLCAAGV